jgi:hypothetical protein
MSQVTHLASGALTRSGDQLLVELVPPDSMPAVVRIVWPAKPSVRKYPLRVSRYVYMMRTCGVCGRGLTAKRSDARYCSPACRQKAYRDRHVWVRWVRLTEQMVGRYPDEAGADELRKLAERFLAIIQAQRAV